MPSSKPLLRSTELIAKLPLFNDCPQPVTLSIVIAQRAAAIVDSNPVAPSVPEPSSSSSSSSAQPPPANLTLQPPQRAQDATAFTASSSSQSGAAFDKSRKRRPPSPSSSSTSRNRKKRTKNAPPPVSAVVVAPSVADAAPAAVVVAPPLAAPLAPPVDDVAAAVVPPPLAVVPGFNENGQLRDESDDDDQQPPHQPLLIPLQEADADPAAGAALDITAFRQLFFPLELTPVPQLNPDRINRLPEFNGLKPPVTLDDVLMRAFQDKLHRDSLAIKSLPIRTNRKRKATEDTTEQTQDEASTATVNEEMRFRQRHDRRQRANPPPQNVQLDSYGLPLTVEPRSRSPTSIQLPTRRRNRQRRRRNSTDAEEADDAAVSNEAQDGAAAAPAPAADTQTPENRFHRFTELGAHGRHYVNIIDAPAYAAKKALMIAAFRGLKPLLSSYAPSVQEALFESARTWLGWSDTSVPIDDHDAPRYFKDEWRGKKALYAITRIVAEDPKLCHPAGKKGRESGLSWMCYADGTYQERPPTKHVFRNEVLFSMAITGNPFTVRGYHLLSQRHFTHVHPTNMKPIMSMSTTSLPVAYPTTSLADPLLLSHYLGFVHPWSTAFPELEPRDQLPLKAILHRLLAPAMFGRFGNRAIFPHVPRFFVGLSLAMKHDQPGFLYDAIYSVAADHGTLPFIGANFYRDFVSKVDVYEVLKWGMKASDNESVQFATSHWSPTREVLRQTIFGNGDTQHDIRLAAKSPAGSYKYDTRMSAEAIINSPDWNAIALVDIIVQYCRNQVRIRRKHLDLDE